MCRELGSKLTVFQRSPCFLLGIQFSVIHRLVSTKDGNEGSNVKMWMRLSCCGNHLLSIEDWNLMALCGSFPLLQFLFLYLKKWLEFLKFITDQTMGTWMFQWLEMNFGDPFFLQRILDGTKSVDTKKKKSSFKETCDNKLGLHAYE